jgi:hypothetical protein
MRSTYDAQTFSNIAATTSNFQLQGGLYEIAVVATFGGGNVVLQQLGPDGSTYLPVHTALTANGVATANVPPGQYRVAITTATAVYVTVARVPGE